MTPLQRSLTAREREVLEHLAAGESDKEIARVLYLSPETIKTHVKHILAKLAAKSRTHAVAIGFRTDLLR